MTGSGVYRRGAECPGPGNEGLKSVAVADLVVLPQIRFAVNPQWNLKNITGAVNSSVIFTIALLVPGR